MYGAELILALRRAWLQNRAELRSAGQFLRTGQALAAVPTQVPNDLTTLEFFGDYGDSESAAEDSEALPAVDRRSRQAEAGSGDCD